MNIKQLYICEKPSQAHDIANVLGCTEKNNGFLKKGDVVVTWCFGHLLETVNPDFYCENIKPWRLEILPIAPTTWQLVVKKECQGQFKIIKGLLKEAANVVVATDADREGEVIARELLDYCKYKGSIQRLWLSALDDASIKKALADIRAGQKTENLYYAGLGRQRADWLIGMNMTMASSVAFGRYGEGVLSVGRVQTPTLKLVVDRDHAIDHFTSRTYYELIAEFTTDKNETFTAKWQPANEHASEDNYILDKNIIDNIVRKIHTQTASVKKFEDKKKNLASPLGLSLSQLQKLASSRFNLSAKQTLEVAQALYETHKAITYPRTDCSHLPESQFQEVAMILSQLKNIQPHLKDLVELCDTSYRSSIWNDKKVTAHHAMIPTANQYVSLSRMNDIEKKIYDTICRYYIAQFLGAYEYAERSVIVTCHEEMFKTASQTPLKPGWKVALQQVHEAEHKDEKAFSIPALQEGQILKETNEQILTKNTKPPARFTEGTLIEAMKSIGKYVQDEAYKKILKETAGIGTEATRAAIIEVLFKRNYLEKQGKSLNATDKGKKLIAQLPSMACDPILTAEWEQELDKVAEGTLTLTSFIEQQKHLLDKMLAGIKSIKPTSGCTDIHPCPLCQKPLTHRQSSKDKAYFWGCSGYPICRFTTNDQNGSPSFKKIQGATNVPVTT